MQNLPGAAPDFKNACVVLFGVNITWVLFVLWAIWGLIAAAALGWCINRVLTLFEARRD
ncbi:hypothetical protein ABMC88_13340 [Sulfitobacter sp. HNIBRBA2951]|uniref:hypothetical protein n=1 Tax=Sulfitobacter aquimarinus TaxID=3158557 RepID=UPI0032E04DEF